MVGMLPHPYCSTKYSNAIAMFSFGLIYVCAFACACKGMQFKYKIRVIYSYLIHIILMLFFGFLMVA